MSTSIVPITLREAPWQALANEIVIGKDILELLSSSMYVDPMTIYREYVQNAADSIDEAGAAGLLKPGEPRAVHIRIDASARNVKISDSGTGIEHGEFANRLTAFGASKKRGRHSRGFRGVGRLAGIGYCQELVFRSRTPGETKVSELRWDCRKLKTILRSTEDHCDLREAVEQVVQLRRIPNAGFPERFFEVEMCGIIRHRNDQLLSAPAIRGYLAQVAPIPFRQDFPFKDDILSHLGSQVRLGDLQIHVSEDDAPVYRPHSEVLEVGVGVFDRFTEVELLSFEGIDSGVACLGWVLHHGYTGALPVSCNVRGLRVRCGNIQVGDDRMFEELFPEARFNGWSVGEFHVLDPRIVPNGRRDHFEQSVHFHNLLAHLAPVAREITRRCRTSSVQRKWSRDFELREVTIREKASIVKQGALSRQGQYRVAEEIRAGIVFLDGIITRGILPDVLVEELRKRKEKLERDVSRILRAPVRASALSDIAPSKRRAYEQLIGLIYECSASPANAKLLVDKILARIT
ncbi:MAG TPA: ATP-binding protein [Terracidiphilus sp.]|jgi:molecular chaperone HtpG